MSRILIGDALDMLRTLPPGSVQCCVTSPPYYGLRDYGVAGQIGQEDSPAAYVARLVEVFREVRRVLADDGALWLNLGDCYANKQRMMIPARVALALQADGWWLRDEIVWHKPRTTPAPVKDRTVSAHEMVYLFAKRERYFYDYLAIEEPSACAGVVVKVGAKNAAMAATDAVGGGKRPTRDMTVRETRRARSVWSISPSPYRDAHFATMPRDLAERCVKAGSRIGDTVLDPFGGAGTTALAAQGLGRRALLIELNPDYAVLAKRRLGWMGAEDLL